MLTHRGRNKICASVLDTLQAMDWRKRHIKSLLMLLYTQHGEAVSAAGAQDAAELRERPSVSQL